MATKDLKKIGKFLDSLNNTVYTQRFFKSTGQQASDAIYRRVKSGFGVDNDTKDKPRRKKLKPLSPSYINQRRRKGVRGEFGSPSRSNLTNTGQMLDSFKVKVSSNGFQVTIPNSARRDSKSNRQIANFVRRVRPFFALTGAEIRIIKKVIRDEVTKVFRKIF